MGLFSELGRDSSFRWPIRVHSEHSLGGAGRWLTGRIARLPSVASRAVNDARLVGTLLLLAAGALALEMAASFK
jgi:hypothetical protein